MADGNTWTRAYRQGALIAEHFPMDDVSDHLADPDVVVWVDITAPGPQDLAQIAAELQLHDLAVEDALTEHQRAKVDRYDSHSFLSAYSARLDPVSGRLTTRSVGAFLTGRALVTVHPSREFDIAAVVQRWDESGGLGGHGVTFLVHGLLDFVVDTHFEAVSRLDDAIDALEDLLFDDRPRSREVHERSFQLRKSLVLLRRVVLPMREVVNTLMRRDLHVIDDEMIPYFQDVYDHVVRAGEWTESLRDLVATIVETNLTIQGNRLNGIMKKVTSWAAIIAVPTAVTGFYGQNVPYPGFATHQGFVASTVAITAGSTALYVAFRRRDWI